MLRADKAQLETELQVTFVAIRQLELHVYARNCQSLGTQAAMIAGFAYAGLSVAIPEGRHDAAVGVYMVLSVAAMGFTFTAVLNSTMASMLGPGYALRGPEGAYHRAVEGTMYEYKLVFLNLVLGMAAFYAAAFAYIWLVFEWQIALPVGVLMAWLVRWTARSSSRVMAHFRLPTGLAVSGRFHVDGTITAYGARTRAAVALEELERRAAAGALGALDRVRGRWLRARVELDEFLGTPDLGEGDAAAAAAAATAAAVATAAAPAEPGAGAGAGAEPAEACAAYGLLSALERPGGPTRAGAPVGRGGASWHGSSSSAGAGPSAAAAAEIRPAAPPLNHRNHRSPQQQTQHHCHYR